MKETDDFSLHQKAITCNHQLLQFTVSKDEWNTKEDTGKYCSMPKGTSWAEATLNSEKIKPIALAIIELRLSEGIRQAAVSRKFR